MDRYPPLASAADVLAMLYELQDGRTAILAACDKLTPEQLHDPVVPGTWSVLKNLAHLAWAEAWMLAWIEVRPGVVTVEPPDVAEDVPALRTALDEAHAAAIAFLKSHPESVLREPCLYGRSDRKTTVGGVFFHLIEHEIGHRGVVKMKLRLLSQG